VTPAPGAGAGPAATLDAIAAQRVVPVIRTADAEDAVATARACAAGGLRVVELTCTTPNVTAALKALRDDDVVAGLGTVTTVEEVRGAAAMGAAFVVSYTNPPGFVTAAHAAGLAAIPGALTPTEVAACLRDGADAVKLFPARAISPAHLRDLRAVMPGLRAMATGGVAAADIPAWLAAGADAVGIGSELGTVAGVGAGAVRERAAALLAAAR
jgi:2-dehydro-3-deoxyphosphogluconate aldolase / (4S)-4-hydroxy-2-oxoglutarate aldolase